MRKVYKMLNISIAFETEFELLSVEGMVPFEISPDSPADETYIFHVCDDLPELRGQQLVDEKSFKVYRDGTKLLFEQFSMWSGKKFFCQIVVDSATPGINQVYYTYPDDVKTLDSIRLLDFLPIEQILASRGTFILHSSAIEYNGEAILFTAPSGTGKTTHANLWVEHEGAEIINGDRTGIRCIDGKWIASGLPYDGSSRKFNPNIFPLKAIVVIRQGKENVIEPLRPAEAFRWILSETAIYYWEKESADIVLEAIRNLVTEIPCYILHCRPDKEAVDTVKKALFK